MSPENNGRRRLLGEIVAGIFGIVLGLTGCGDAPSGPSAAIVEEKPRTGGTYRRAFSSPIMKLDPAEVNDSYSHEVARQVFDGLLEFDEDGRPVPALAASWTISADRLTYRLTLRADARFQAKTGPDDVQTLNGGRSVTAEDVSYTLHRLLAPGHPNRKGKNYLVIRGAAAYNASQAASIEGIRVVSSDTIELTLDKPFTPFLSLLALNFAFIVPREDAEALGENFGWNPVGAGPFSWGGRASDTLVLKANPGYYRGRPYLDRIEFPVIADEIERFRRFKSGELMHNDVPDPEYKNVLQDPLWARQFQEVSRWGIYYLGFDVKTPPFDNVKVRQAMNYAIDREAIVKLVINDRARIARGALPPGIMGYNPKLRGYSYDLAKARTLLAEAGYPGGKGFPEITLEVNRDEIHIRTAEFVLANLRDIGISCRMKVVDFPELLADVQNGRTPFFRMGFTVDYPDPDNFLYSLFHSGNIGPAGNYSRYANPRVDELLDRARFEIDAKERVALYRDAEQLIVDDAPLVFVFHYTTHGIWQPYVHGMKVTPMGTPYIAYRQLWLSSPTARLPGK
ncbi:MAG TPA: ABC transporter substrate-binding protein [Candidatus Ozemobacteraceae bacterium]|nr:ABC transporter substrate-binding protein [Candidatus Ozemobacteraceae bacterium]